MNNKEQPVNYKIVHDGIFSHIVKTYDKADDDDEVFNTFKKAQRELLKNLRKKVKELRECIENVKAMKSDNIETEDKDNY